MQKKNTQTKLFCLFIEYTIKRINLIFVLLNMEDINYRLICEEHLTKAATCKEHYESARIYIYI
jgi:hypothetical protein